MSPPWFSRSRRARKDAAHKRLADAAYLRGVEDGKAQGWQECEVHYRPLLLELQREKAVLETRRQLAALAADQSATEPPETGEGVSIPGRTVTTQRTTGTVKVRMTTRPAEPETGKEKP